MISINGTHVPYSTYLVLGLLLRIDLFVAFMQGGSHIRVSVRPLPPHSALSSYDLRDMASLTRLPADTLQLSGVEMP